MKSMLVIGMGRMGRHLAEKLSELKNDVMIVDKDEEIIEELASGFTDAQIGDCTNEKVLRALGVGNFDICFVTIGNDFQSSLEITSLLKELGARYVISKARRDIQAKFLLRNGADEVVYPERQIAEGLAIRCSANNIFNAIELTHDYSIFEIPVLNEWIDKSIAEIDVRNKHQINVLAVKQGDSINPMPSPDYTFMSNDHAIVLGRPSNVYKLSSRIKEIRK